MGQEALDKIMEDKSLVTIVIAHRMGTIRGSDKIAYVSHGKVRESGTYEELMAKPNGHYRRLEELQSLDRNENRASLLQNKKSFKDEDKKDKEKEGKPMNEEGNEDEKEEDE